MRKRVSRKLLSLLLTLLMVTSLLPMTALADEEVTADSSAGSADTVQAAETGSDADADQAEVGEEEEILPAADRDTTSDSEEITYVTKEKNVPLSEGTFYRSLHLDCGRKYFSVSDIKTIIDYAAEYNYTHVELAFGNDGLRFLLNDMSISANGNTYESNAVTSAIQAGNDDYDNSADNSSAVNTTEELTETEMDTIIQYAKDKGIGIIPMFNAPGHMHAVIVAMQQLGLSMVENTDYSVPTTSGESANWAVNPTDVAGINFVQALAQKYITYFAGKGCTMFNIAADECGFASMDDAAYTAYAKLVNSMAARVQNAGMTALAFSDGFYYVGKTLKDDISFDTNIAICYWTAGEKYATAASLYKKGFKIINTNTHWYYVIGKETTTGSNWSDYAYHQDYAVSNMSANGSCLKVDGDSNGAVSPSGCMAAIWCDNPSASVNWNNVKAYVAALKTGNPTCFTSEDGTDTPDPTPESASLTVGQVGKGVSVNGSNVILTPSDTKDSGWTLTLNVVNGTDGASYSWTSTDTGVATVADGLVTFTGTAGQVTIQASENTNAADANGGIATIAEGQEDSDANGDVLSITFNVVAANAGSTTETTPKRIAVTVGQTATDTIEGTNLYVEGTTYTTDDSSIATVKVSGADSVAPTVGSKISSLSSGSSGVISDGNGNYLVIDSNGDISNTQDIAEATAFTVTSSGGSWNTKYALQGDNGKYLIVQTSGYGGKRTYTLSTSDQSSSSWSYSSNNGFYYSNGSGYLGFNNGWGLTTSSSSTGALYSVTEGTPASTTVTFSGIAAGTTTFTTGTVAYKVTVTTEDLSKVTPLPVQTWLTNCLVRFSGDITTASSGGYSSATAYYLKIPANASGVYSEEGAALSELFPSESGVKEYGGTYYSSSVQSSSITSDWASRQAFEIVPFKGVMHSSDVQVVWGTDYSNDACTSFYYIRYWGGNWQASPDGTNWTTIDTSALSKTTGSSSSSGTQLVVYYMMRTQITDEVITDVADWGYRNTQDEYSSHVTSKDYVLLDFAVKYEDNTRNPDSFPQDGKTFLFHCTSGKGGVIDSGSTRYRQLNNFRGVNTGNYEVYMVTVTMTNDASDTTISDTTSYSYDGTEQIVWAIDEDTYTNSRFAAYTSISGSDSAYSGCRIGGDPYIRGVEVYNQHGALITYYVRAKKTTDTLTVNYYAEGSDTPFYTYNIAVNGGTTFNSSFGMDENGALVNNTVVNSTGVTQTVQSDLKQMPAVPAQYRYQDYTLKQADKSEDLKTANLYYSFNSSKTFVVDFGLPLTIQPKDINANLGGEGISITSVTLSYSNDYATINSDDTTHSISYALKKMLDSKDTFGVQYKGTLSMETGSQDGSTVEYTISVIPATSVYYEDSFATFKDGAGSAAGATWSVDGTTQTATQALEELGQKKNLYGTDPAYSSGTTFSLGSAHKVTVSTDMLSKWSESEDSAWPTAEFTFRGTGFDIISLTDNTSGAIRVNVVRTDVSDDDTENAYNKNFLVNNYYGYKQNEDGSWEASPTDASNALYQIPVMKVTDLALGTYKVTIKVSYASYFDKTGKNAYNFWLDGIRIYNPMGQDYADYSKDQEGYPQYLELRSALTSDAASKAVFIDGAADAKVSTYSNYGPNHEVYLSKGQAITFKLTAASDGALSKIASVQVGAKTPNGSSAVMKVNDASTGTTISTATEMYYDITAAAVSGGSASQITITNDGEGILSLTNLKITYAESGYSLAFDSLTEEDQSNAVNMVRLLYAVPVEEEEEVFTPETFQASWNRSSVTAGQKATLTIKTSQDVESVVVNGETIDTYRTRSQRKGFFGAKTTYREFTYSLTASETTDYTIVAVNSEGVASDAITTTLTVKSSQGGWWQRFLSLWS